jgi:Uma2 family endonuclease
MSAQRQLEYITADEYLLREKDREPRHEYVNGAEYAMSGSSRRHNLICGNLVSLARSSKRFRKPCQIYSESVKVRVEPLNRFYYPDLLVSCRPERDDYVVSKPCLIVEVISPSTASTDRREKLEAYRSIASLSSYVLVEQDFAQITVLRRDREGWTEQLLGLDDLLMLDCLELEIPVQDVYEGIQPLPTEAPEQP